MFADGGPYAAPEPRKDAAPDSAEVRSELVAAREGTRVNQERDRLPDCILRDGRTAKGKVALEVLARRRGLPQVFE